MTALLAAQTIAVGHDDRIDAIYWMIQAVTHAVAAGLVVGTPRLGQPPGGDAATGRHPSVTRIVAQDRIGAGRTADGERELRTSAPPVAQARWPSSALATIVAIRRRAPSPERR